MKLFRKYRTLWMMGIIVVLAILFITNFSAVVSGFDIVVRSVTSLLGGAALAFVLNLIMDPVEKRYASSNKKYIKSHARSLAILTSFVVMFVIIILILSIIIPNMVNAIQMLTSEAPQYFTEVEDLVHRLLKNYPSVAEKFSASSIDWDQTFQTILRFITNGSSETSVVDSTMNLVSSFVGFFVNTFIVIVFASYVLSEKERFVQGYYTFLNLFVAKNKRYKVTRDLRIVNQSFKSFIVGEIIEAAILSTMCIVGMLILQLPYATMIGILVGVINMIPMIGAFIGGGIGAFIIFTISPTKCLIFLVFLCIIQQIESNIFFPRVIGNKVGLPGIYVMMTIVIGGTLFGVVGMILGVPLMASVYKIAKIDLSDLKDKREAQQKMNELAIRSRKKGNVVDKMKNEVRQLRDSVNPSSDYLEEEEQIEEQIMEDERLRATLDSLLLSEERIPIYHPDDEEEDNPHCDVDPLEVPILHAGPDAKPMSDTAEQSVSDADPASDSDSKSDSDFKASSDSNNKSSSASGRTASSNPSKKA